MWFSKFFGKNEPRDEQVDSQIVIVAQLNARVQPIDRGDYFEDPLDQVLKSSGFGEVSGGGTQLADEPDGIAYCDVEIVVNDLSSTTISTIIDCLEQLGAPKGSLLKLFNGHDDVPFGKLEGMALFLNGTDLPAEVYAASDVNKVISNCNELLDGQGKFRGHWEGSRETALYFYGGSFEAMKLAVTDFINEDPGCKLARIVQIA